MKRYRVTISDEVFEAVRKRLRYISEELSAPLAAERWWRRAMKMIFSLETMPDRCPLAPENAFSKATIRMLIVDRCLFLYTIDEEDSVVRVLRFRDGSQVPKSLD